MPATTLQALSAHARYRKRLLVKLRTILLFLILGVMFFVVGRLIYMRKHAAEMVHEPGWELKQERRRLLEEEKQKMKLPRQQ